MGRLLEAAARTIMKSHFGGWIGGILGGVVLLPVLGLLETSLAIITLKVSGMALLVSGARKSP